MRGFRFRTAPIFLILPVVLFVFVLGAMSLRGDEDEPASGEATRLWVGPETVDCVGVGPRTCLLVSTTADGEREFFYEGIEGFTHMPGTSYVLDVEVTEVADPPADGSSLAYRLIAVVDQD